MNCASPLPGDDDSPLGRHKAFMDDLAALPPEQRAEHVRTFNSFKPFPKDFAPEGYTRTEPATPKRLPWLAPVLGAAFVLGVAALGWWLFLEAVAWVSA